MTPGGALAPRPLTHTPSTLKKNPGSQTVALSILPPLRASPLLSPTLPSPRPSSLHHASLSLSPPLRSVFPFRPFTRGRSAGETGRKEGGIHFFSALSAVSAQQADGAPAAPPPPAPVKENSDVRAVPVTDNTFTLRGISNERLKFEVEYGLKKGTTENSYVLCSPPSSDTPSPLSPTLIDVPDQSFASAFLLALSQLVPLGDLRHVVIGHLSPKRVPSLLALLEERGKEAPPLTVHCTNPAALLLQSSLPDSSVVGRSLVIRTVKPGEDSLDVGAGHVLRFIPTPTPRWPDAMCTYDPATSLLFSQKLFSAHICTDADFDVGGWALLGQHWQFFFDCMIGPAAKQAEAALEKLPIEYQFATRSYSDKTGMEVVKGDLGFIWSSVFSRLNVDLSLSTKLSSLFRPSSGKADSLSTAAICPLHGPIVRSSVNELVRDYRKWTAEKVKQSSEATVAVIYASAYGNTSALAQAISHGITRSGAGLISLNCEFSSKQEIAGLMSSCQAFVIGSPTLGGHVPTPVQTALGVILQDPANKVKPCGVFGSFGWSGEAVDEIEKKLKDAGYSLVFPSIRCKFKPTEAMLQTCEESGRDIAVVVKKQRMKDARLKGVAEAVEVASTVEQAVGRVVGPLCVVAARTGDAESAMLASWVSQASFNPPGITVAVAKDRAVESLVLPGSTFALSVLSERDTPKVYKQLLKKFVPGEPRFGDLPTKQAENGSTILTDAVSFLECTVQSRMDTLDHWVLYAVVDNGKVQNDKAFTSVHHRKTGAKY